jgi:hypothetical protein
MKELNGYKYSFTQFDGYCYRVLVDIAINVDETIYTDIYTDNNNTESIWDDLMELFIQSGKCILITAHKYKTKEEDDLASEFINELLN